MQLGLLIATVDPLVGGVLILGDRGTGKSTAVRALAAVLPDLETLEGCPYRCALDRTAGLGAACGASVSSVASATSAVGSAKTGTKIKK